MERETEPSDAASGAVPPDRPQDGFPRHAAPATEPIAPYLANIEAWRALPPTRPGQVRAALPPAPPEEPEPMDRILADFARLILPNTTHWNHPGFFAYFPASSTEPGIIGELLAA